MEILIKTTEKPIKPPLSQLSVVDLKRVGITLEETGDEVAIKAKDSGIDRIVGSILKEEKEIGEMGA